MSHLFQNSTGLTLTLSQADVSDVHSGLIVMGRCPSLKAQFEQRAGRKFHSPHWMHESKCELLRFPNSRILVLRIPFRPKGSSRGQRGEAERCYEAIASPLRKTIYNCRFDRLSMIPISCRNSKAVVAGTVRTIWDFSVAAFLNTDPLLASRMPKSVDLFCLDSIDPFLNYLKHGHYSFIRNGWSFNTAVCCDRAKMRRYIRRKRFKFAEITG